MEELSELTNEESRVDLQVKKISISIDYDRRINFAMQQNDVPVVKLLQIKNNGDSPLENTRINVWIESDLSKQWEGRVSEIPSNGTYNFDVVDLLLNSDVLARQTERESSRLCVQVFEENEKLHEEAYPIEVLAYNEWGGLRSLPEVIAAFVMPNHPAVEQVLISAKEHLKASTGDPSLAGYQIPNRTRSMVDAIYNSLLGFDIAYINPPASFEQDGQKIRTPDKILDSKLGTCLDLTLLCAACLEQAGLNPLIILVEGHSFVGVWLKDESFAEPFIDNAARLRKRIHLEEMLTFESTAITSKPPKSAELAIKEGLQHLQDDSKFACAIDIRAARRMRIRPLPLRVSAGTFNLVDSQPIAISGQHTSVAPIVSVETEIDQMEEAAEQVSLDQKKDYVSGNQRLERWKRKLLDLSLRNRLINHKESKTCVPLICADICQLEDVLAAGKAFSIHPKPSIMDADDPRRAEIHQARTGEDAIQQYLQGEFSAKRLRSNLSHKEVGRRLTEIYRSARLSLEESGANTLFLALGFLRWYESETSNIERKAPILLLPLQIERRSMHEGFKISLADEDARINVTLVEKLKSEFGIRNGELSDLPEDSSGLDMAQIFRNFRSAIKNMDRWDVIEEAHVSLFSFTKFLMWLDLQERSENLLQNRVVKHLAEKPEMAFDPDGRFPDACELDTKRQPAETICPLDADSSQLCAVYAAQDGRSFVLEGPPGTGKSQTITNIIANCLASGKRVLFVSEKMAALNVVHHRLCRVMLGSFCLELHSNKSSKKGVLEQLALSSNGFGTREPAEWHEVAKKLQEVRTELNRYVEEIHKPYAIGNSIFQVTSKLIGMKNVEKILFDPQIPIEELTRDKLGKMREHAERLSLAGKPFGLLASHPLSAIRLKEWRTTLADEVKSAVDTFVIAAENFESSANECFRSLKLMLDKERFTITKENLEILTDASEFLLSCPPVPSHIMTEAGWNELQPKLQEWVDRGKNRDLLRAQLFERYDESLLELDLESLLSKLQRTFEKKGPLSWFSRRRVRKTLKNKVREGVLPPNGDLAEDLQKAICLIDENKFLSDPENEPSRLFGSYWKQGEAVWVELENMLDWATRFRDITLRVSQWDIDLYKQVRERFISLVCEDRELLEQSAPLGQILERFRSHFGDFDKKWQNVLRLLELKEGQLDELGGDEYVQSLKGRAKKWRENRHFLRDWCFWCRVRDEAIEAGLEPFIEACEAGKLAISDLPDVLERTIYEWWLNSVINSNEILRHFNRMDHEQKIKSFRELDLKHIKMARELLYAKLAHEVPSLNNTVSENSEVGILQREFLKSRKHMPLRKLFKKIPNLLPKLKPCFLMSPLSVAQYLDVNLPMFDTVIFDEASQMPVWDSIGAIARGKELIVVGDSKQLPPTSFFMKQEDDDELPDEDDIEELESILDECVAARLPRLYLNWHYRSRHDSLITFSNYHYYGNRLLTFPPAEKFTEELGVSLLYLPDGLYDRGNTRTNRVEAENVVTEIVQRLRNGNGASIGVVTFSLVQQQLVEDLLDDARRRYPEIDQYFTDAVPEPVFIKNLENVQGDERDIILLSVCYGKDHAGRRSVSFGPLNRQGGERRLNVAITRARKRVIVISSIKGEDIDLSRTNSVGVKHLKTFLEYAENGEKAIAEAVTVNPHADFDSPFEQEVYRNLVERGWEVDIQVGCSGYRIDLAVKDPQNPGRYLMGIECDGANYHSSRNTRDRDRLRQAVLEDLGWKLYRIWSTDWWIDPQREMERLEIALEDAKKMTVATPSPTIEEEQDELQEPDVFSEVGVDTPTEYQFGIFSAPSSHAAVTVTDEKFEIYKPTYESRILGNPNDFYDANTTYHIQRRITEVLIAEAPIHIGLLTRRVASCWQLQKMTKRAQARVHEVMQRIHYNIRPVERGDFVWKVDQNPAEYLGFRLPDTEDPSPRKAEEIPPQEIANAAEWILQRQISLPKEDLMRETARLFGIHRMGSKVISSLEVGIETLQKRNTCTIEGDIVSQR